MITIANRREEMAVITTHTLEWGDNRRIIRGAQEKKLNDLVFFLLMKIGQELLCAIYFSIYSATYKIGLNMPKK
jgi:hypothetical protein